MDGTRTIPSHLWLVSDEQAQREEPDVWWNGWERRAAIEDELREDYEDDRYDQQHAGAF